MTPELLKATFLSSFQSNERYVTSLNDFYQHTYLHRKRVMILGQRLLNQFTNDFPQLNSDLLNSFLSIHDEAKLDLETANTHQGSLLEALYRFYGRGVDSLSKREKRELKELVTLLNDLDNQICRQFFIDNDLVLKNGTLSEAAIQLLRIEKIVDSVDRGMNQVSIEEFNRSMTPASQLFHDKDAEMASDLERIYHHLLAGLLKPQPELLAS